MTTQWKYFRSTTPRGPRNATWQTIWVTVLMSAIAFTSKFTKLITFIIRVPYLTIHSLLRIWIRINFALKSGLHLLIMIWIQEQENWHKLTNRTEFQPLIRTIVPTIVCSKYWDSHKLYFLCKNCKYQWPRCVT